MRSLTNNCVGTIFMQDQDRYMVVNLLERKKLVNRGTWYLGNMIYMDRTQNSHEIMFYYDC